MNRCVLVGRLTKNPELRHTSNNVAVCSFTIAINRPFGENEADFIDCQTWRVQAENLAKYMKKGSMIGIDGRIQSRSYNNKEGKTVYTTEVIADVVQFLEKKE